MHMKIVGGTASLGAGETKGAWWLLGVWDGKGESDLFPHERLPPLFFTLCRFGCVLFVSLIEYRQTVMSRLPLNI